MRQRCAHDFRRIFATDALRAELPLHVAAKILGHVDLNTTLGYAATHPVIGSATTFSAYSLLVIISSGLGFGDCKLAALIYY